jgi:hypothetical protein
MSAGMPTGKIWVIPIREAAKLRILSTPDTAGTFRMEFNLIGPGNRVLAQRTVSATFLPPDTTGTASLAAPGADALQLGLATPQPAAPSQASRLDAEEESILLQRGEELLRQGGIAAARLLFEELALRGSGKGALALARSYDPAFVKASPASAVSPNIEEAVKWYDRAAELGVTEAKQRRAEIAAGR